METMSMPVLSTGHLPSNKAIENAGLYNAPYEHGWFLWVRPELAAEDFPEWYVTLCNWAKQQGFEWVRFDCDADKIDELPTWEW